jgi:beta-glucanase (GH16 family)
VIDVELSGPAIGLAGGISTSFAKGIWPAVWLLPDGDWPTGGEIDLSESMHFKPENANEGFSTLHFGPHEG